MSNITGLGHTWFRSSDCKTQLEMCQEQSGHDLSSVPQRPHIEQSGELSLHWPGPHLSRLASSCWEARLPFVLPDMFGYGE